jgi:DNA-binding MarR family transcriptional regulator
LKRGTHLVIISIITILSLWILTIQFNGIEGLRYTQDTSLANVDASFLGENTTDMSGYAIAGVGDVNGDGYNDFVIGAPFNNNKGKTYLFFGRASGWAMDVDLAHANASFIAEHEWDYAGLPVAGAGDVNGDGYDDILIGAPDDSDGGYNRGKTYLIFGKPSGWAMNTSLSNADASFIGEQDNVESGGSVGGAGDVNGDGYDDFLIGALWDDTLGYGTGKTYLIFGKASGWAKNTSLSMADVSFIGEHMEDHAGFSVSGVGDVNGDKYDDFVIGALGNDDHGSDAGKTYLIFGKAAGWTKNTNLSKADASFVGEHEEDNSGCSVSYLGDVNGDGYNDILIGARLNSDGGLQAGKAYLIFGKVKGWTKNTILSEADGSFIGEHDGTQAGFKVAGGGDFNGDGYDDILIGAPMDSNGSSQQGKTYLIFGKASGWARDTSLSNTDVSFIGEHQGDFSGTSIAGAGDVNGDGIDDILIGAPSDNPGGDGGETYLIFRESNSKPVSINSVKAYSDSGYSFEIKDTLVNDTVFIELQGVDGNSNQEDIAFVKISSNLSDPVGFILRLSETGKNTGIYRGNFVVKNETNAKGRWIKALGGENVTVASVQDPSKKATISIFPSLLLFPVQEQYYTYVNQPIKIHFWATGPGPITWQEVDSSDWLLWDNQTHNISGTPDNGDVGNHWVRITLSIPLNDVRPITYNYTITVLGTPPKNVTTNNNPPVAIVTAATGITIGVISLGIVLSSEIGQFGAVLFLSPLYSKTRKETILDNFTRGKIFQFIVDHPGAHFRQIRNELGLNTGLATFHLKKLEIEGMVKSQRIGLKKYFYTEDEEPPLKPSIEKQILTVINANPGITQKDLAKELDISKSTIHDYIKRMKMVNRVKTVRNGKETKCYLIETGQDDG